MGLMGNVKKPFYLLLANGSLVGLSLGKDIKSISFTDQEGTHADKVTITVVSPDYIKPKKGDELILFFGYDGVPFMPCGIFTVDGSRRIDNRVLVVRATGVNFKGKIKEKKSKTFEKTTLKDIVALKAKENGLASKCDFKVKIKHLTQTNQSDLDFLKKLADEYNAIFTIKNRTLIFVKKKQTLPMFTFDAESVANIDIEETSKKEFKACECKYHDHKKNKEIKVKVGNGKPILHFTGSFKDKTEAKIKAKAKLDKENEGIIRGSLTTEGSICYAGANMILVNTIHGENDGLYKIKTVSHTMNASGWTMTVEFSK